MRFHTGKLLSVAVLLASGGSQLCAANILQSIFQLGRGQVTELEQPLIIGGGDGLVHYSELHESDLPINVRQYVGELVIRVHYRGNEEFRKFLLLNKHSSEADEEGKIDYKVWAKSETGGYIDLQISEDGFFKLVEKFSTPEYQLDYEVMVEDLAQTVFESYPRGAALAQYTGYEMSAKYGEGEEVVRTSSQDLAHSVWRGDSKRDDEAFAALFEAAKNDPSGASVAAYTELFFREYRPLDTINAWLDILAQTFPDLVKIEEIGSTYEHRTYKVVHLQASTHEGNSGEEKKKTIVITGGVHAREWISISSVCYALYGLLQAHSENPLGIGILENLDFLFIPVLNPDGYVYSWTQDRLWRKNRQETIHPRCFGLDIDHSYDYHWTKSLDWACGEEYSGEVPFEAIESRIWDDFLNATNHNHDIMGYIDLHSYAQEVLYPYAYSCLQQPRDEENLIELAYGISKAIRLQSGKNYQVIPACVDKDLDLLPDLGSGSALDFMYHNKAFWAYQLKLRDSGNHGFLLPGKYIEPVGKEILAGIRYFISFILKDD